MQQVIFRLLGPPEISYNEQLIRIPRRRSRALLYYMISTHMPQPRERLLALLCGEMDDESARHAFKTMLAEARAQLRSFDSSIDWIISDGDLLTFNPLAPTWLDTEIFEKNTAATSRNLNQAIQLYRGDFLDGFFLKDSSSFDSWIRSTRDHFRHRYLSALRQLAELNEANDQFEQALACIHLLLDADPLAEEAHAHLMRLYWMMGDRTEALRQYERLRALLAQELAVKPSPTTQALYEQIARSNKWPIASSPSSPSSLSFRPTSTAFEVKQNDTHLLSSRPLIAPEEAAPAHFVGRARELAWLQERLTCSTNGAPLVLLSGEVGSGKTALIRELCKLESSNWLVLSGTCQQVERKHAYHAVIEALHQGLNGSDIAQAHLPGSWLAALARFLPDLFPFDEPGQLTGPFEPIIFADALVSLFEQLADSHRPVMLQLDDLHWADKATLALLGHLLRHVRHGSVCILATVQSGHGQKRLAPLRQSASRLQALAELELPPLTREEIVELVALHISQHPALVPNPAAQQTLGEWVYQRSEGNPFFALEWLTQALKGLTVGQALADTPIPATLQTPVTH
jgi:DNA-binding SARP family transcriptional activator/type II secretory pathway predicted ATPase ExeA